MEVRIVTATRFTLGALAWLAILIGILGAMLGYPDYYICALIAASVAAIGWGLIRALQDDVEFDDTWERRHHDNSVPYLTWDGAKQAVPEDDDLRAHWDTTINGAPE